MRKSKARVSAGFWLAIVSCIAASLVLALPLFAEDTDDNGRTEAYWRQRAENIRSQIRYQEENIAHFRERQRTCEERRGSEVYTDCERRYGGSIKRAELRIEEIKNDLDRLADEARKAGAMPGWIRE